MQLKYAVELYYGMFDIKMEMQRVGCLQERFKEFRCIIVSGEKLISSVF